MIGMSTMRSMFSGVIMNLMWWARSMGKELVYVVFVGSRAIL